MFTSAGTAVPGARKEDIVNEPNQTLEGASLVCRWILRPH
jgi:hypothetical protein